MSTSCDAPRRAVRSSFDAVALARRIMGFQRGYGATATSMIERRLARESAAHH